METINNQDDQKPLTPAQEAYDEDHEATYCPEDNKLRIYPACRLYGYKEDSPLKDAMHKAGYIWASKQGCFVAHWSPAAEDIALDLCGSIEDEDKGPAERAADRAERFSDYRDKRASEAHGFANRYDSGPRAHGYQSEARAERARGKHDRLATYACNQWSKAEYWQSRTKGVISHALYVSKPGVRARRIKTLEAEERKHHKHQKEHRDDAQTRQRVALSIVAHAEGAGKIALDARTLAYYISTVPSEIEGEITPGEYQRAAARAITSSYYSGRWGEYDFQLRKGEIDGLTVAKAYLEAVGTEPLPDYQEGETRWGKHYALRLAYERQMLQAEVGELAEDLPLAPGWHAGTAENPIPVHSVAKSQATGKAVSVQWFGKRRDGSPYLKRVTLGHMSADKFSPPSEASMERLKREQTELKAVKQTEPKAPPIVNITNEDAERLQAVWNEEAKTYGVLSTEPRAVLYMTQAQYSERSKGSYAKLETAEVRPGGSKRNVGTILGGACARIRCGYYQVVVLTDKPQKAFPDWEDWRPAVRREVLAKLADLYRVANTAWHDERTTPEDRELFAKACVCGLAYKRSMTQYGLTEAGQEACAAAKVGCWADAAQTVRA